MKNQKIIEQLRSGKYQPVFNKLYRYFPKVEKLILSKGGTKEDAQDIFQEALIILHRKAQDPQFTLTSKPETYLYSVCRFLWKDEMVKRGKQLTGMVEDASLEDAVEREQRYEQAELALSSLGEKCRQILERFYLQAQRMIEIARELGLASENVAKTQKYKCLERAKKKLRELKAADQLSTVKS